MLHKTFKECQKPEFSTTCRVLQCSLEVVSGAKLTLTDFLWDLLIIEQWAAPGAVLEQPAKRSFYPTRLCLNPLWLSPTSCFKRTLAYDTVWPWFKLLLFIWFDFFNVSFLALCFQLGVVWKRYRNKLLVSLRCKKKGCIIWHSNHKL